MNSQDTHESETSDDSTSQKTEVAGGLPAHTQDHQQGASDSTALPRDVSVSSEFALTTDEINAYISTPDLPSVPINHLRQPPSPARPRTSTSSSASAVAFTSPRGSSSSVSSKPRSKSSPGNASRLTASDAVAFVSPNGLNSAAKRPRPQSSPGIASRLNFLESHVSEFPTPPELRTILTQVFDRTETLESASVRDKAARDREIRRLKAANLSLAARVSSLEDQLR
jgi:hypothetical protein